MKKLFFYLSVCFIISLSARAAVAPYWVWSHHFNGRIHEVTYHNDYIYTAGTYTDSAFIFGNANLSNNGGQDVVIMKWDTLGNMIWARNIYGSNNERVSGIKVNANNQLVLAGYSNSAQVHIGATTLNGNGNNDIYLATYDLNGNNLNAFIYGSAAAETAVDMCLDAGNNIYVASNSNVTKYSSNGSIVWQQNMSGIFSVNYSVFDNTIVLCGSFLGNMTLGNTTITAYYGMYGVQPDIFLTKFSTSGTVQWLINVTNDPRGSGKMQTYIQDLSGKIFIAYFYVGLSIYHVLREVSPAGVNFGGHWYYSFGNISIDGKDEYVSVSFDSDDPVDYTFLGIHNYIFNINTQQNESMYTGIGGYNVNYAGFQCFRRIDAIYTCDNATIRFGKVGGGVLTANPSNITQHKCAGTQVTLNGNITGGVGVLTYSWLPVTGLNNTNTNTVTFTANANISYTLTVTDAVGQIAKDTFNILVETPLPAANITSQFPTFCNGSMMLYSNTGVAGSWAKFDGNAWINFGFLNENATITSPGKYRYYVANICNTSTDTIDIAGTATVYANASDDTVCSGQSVTVWGSGAVSYTWSGFTDSATFIPATTQNYTVTGTDANGCINTSSITVTVNPLPVVNIHSTPPFVCNQGNTLLSLYPVQSYCIPTINLTGLAYNRITNFSFNGISTNSGVNNFQCYNYYNLTSNVTAGNTYAIAIYQAVSGIPQGGGHRKVWIDLNRDGDFTDAGEVLLNSTSNNAVLLTNITIPANATNGLTRMRVGTTSTNPNFSPCSTNTGEYEDYNLFISGNNLNNVSWAPNNFLNNTFGTAVDVNNLNATTTYTATVTDAQGCSNTDTITIFAYANTTSYTNASICINQIPYVWAGLNIDSPGVYTATIPNANGCDSVATLNLNISMCGLCQPDFTVNWTPFLDSLVESQTWILTSGKVLIPLGAKVKFDANAGGYVQLNPGFRADSGAVFVAQAYNGCTAGAPQLPQLAKRMNTDLQMGNEIVLYPNPTSGLIHITHDEKLSSIQIFDMVGKLITDQKCAGETQTSIDLSHLPNGVYHVKAAGYNSIKVVKSN